MLRGIVLICFFLTGCQSHPSAPPSMVPHVQVAEVLVRDVPIEEEWITTLDGFVNANIQPEVSGYLVRQIYNEGSFVHKGDVLFEIDPRPFKVELEKAQAQLAQAEAQLGKAAKDLKRDTPLAKLKAIAQSQLDDESEAKLAAQASVASASADVDQAELNLEFTHVRSLVDGVAGIAKTQIGNLVSSNTLLTTVSQVDPIKAYVAMTETEFSHYLQQAKEGEFFVELMLQDGTTFAHKGKFIFADRQIDSGTGTILVAASFPNPGNVLRPGQFGRLRAVMDVKKNALLVPQRAVTELQGANQVAVVGDDNKVSIKTVMTGPTVGSLWVIEQGLKPGDRVIVEGTQNVKDGMVVNP